MGDMTDKAPESDKKEAERRFNETLSRLVNTPHKPHEASKLGRNKTGAKSDKSR